MAKRKKIAVIVASSIYNQKGLFNAVHNRIKYLRKLADYDIEPYILSTYKNFLITKLTRREYVKRPTIYSKEGITYHVLWRKNSIIDFILYHKLHQNELFHSKYDKKIASLFKDYNLLDVHSGAGNLALQVNKKYGIPFIISWHGSDIHTSPFNSISQREKTKVLLEVASYNCFVSYSLVEAAKKFSKKFKYKVLYNGANELFYKYPEPERLKLRKINKVYNKKVVAYIGNIMGVKNPLSLPEIFKSISKQYNGKIQYWIIGDGKLRPLLENKLKDSLLDYVIWGNQQTERIPELLQCIDVIVLPSLNEGFGMVLVEALKCGANAVASRTGGTVEILGNNDTFVLDDSFISSISTRIVYYLNNRIEQPINDCFSWNNTAYIENNIINSILY